MEEERGLQNGAPCGCVPVGSKRELRAKAAGLQAGARDKRRGQRKGNSRRLLWRGRAERESCPHGGAPRE